MTRMTARAAASRLGVHESTVSRWLQRHPALRGADGLVDLAELTKHRDALLNPALQRRPNAASVRADDGGAGRPVQLAAYSDPRARRGRVQADTAELEMAERLGRTVARARVEMAAAEAVAAWEAAGREEARRRADRLATIGDVREMEAALAELFAATRARVRETLARAVQPAEGDDDH